MVIDILFLFAMVMAVFKGYTKGFIIGLFTFVAYYIGLAAALKLSSTVAQHIAGKDAHPSFWLPLLSFLGVFIAVVIIVNLFARMISGLFKLAALGWIDRIAGIVLFVVLYLFIFSILLFYAERISMFSDEVTSASKVYPYISPIAPSMIDFLGKALPFFKDMFNELQNFFESASHNLGTAFFLLEY